ncbi:MAG: Nif3-like dinuclear metal center hexameric protein [bacterium]
MKSINLYEQLEKDFITIKMSDEWAEYMDSVADFLSENFKKRSMGLVCDFTAEVNKVYTAVFPEKEIMQKILDSGAHDAMLFVHHPSIWNIRNAPEVFQQMDRALLKKFKDRRISIYNLHVPLDNYGDYSTSVTLAKSLGVEPEKPFGLYFGSLCGVFGKTSLVSVYDLKKIFQASVGHEVRLYGYGDKKIKNKIVALAAGGGNNVEILEEIAKAGANTFITGITVKSNHSKAAHEFAEKYKINIIGGTHYSTEKFACMAIVYYFKKFGLPAEFIAGKPIMEDI